QLLTDLLGQRLEMAWRDRQIAHGLQQPGRSLKRTGGRAGDDGDRHGLRAIAAMSEPLCRSIGEKGQPAGRARVPDFVESDRAIAGEEFSSLDLPVARALAIGAEPWFLGVARLSVGGLLTESPSDGPPQVMSPSFNRGEVHIGPGTFGTEAFLQQS